MPSLLVARHAQAQPYAARDRDRPLTEKGVVMARTIGRMIGATNVPQRALVSSATRARQTLDVAVDAGGWATDARMLDELYGCGPTDVLDVLHRHGGDAASVLVVGHEPWCSGLVQILTGSRLRMAPAALAAVRIGPDWDALDPSWCVLEWFAPPVVAAQLLATGDDRRC